MSALASEAQPAVAPFLQGLAEAFARCESALPGSHFSWLAAQRRDHLAAALAGGLPGARQERWRSTSLRALERRGIDLARAGSPADAQLAGLELPGLGADAAALPRLVFVDGYFRAELSRLDALPPGLELQPISRGARFAIDQQPDACTPVDVEEARWRRLMPAAPSTDPADAFLNLNAALAADGVLLRVPAGTSVELPVQVVFAGSVAAEGSFWNLRNLVELGAGASLTLIEHHLDAGTAPHVGNIVTHIEVGAGARLHHVRLQHGDPAALRIADTDVRIAACASYLPLALELGGALSRHEWKVALEGREAAFTLRGLVLADGRQGIDTRLSTLHVVGDTRSDTAWRSIADQRARAVFHGGITIAQGADGSDAALQTRSMLLSDAATVEAQPVLVIHADEVKASHGAAIGQFDAAALFYLRSRGIPEDEGRRLLLSAFCAEMLAAPQEMEATEGAAAPRQAARPPAARGARHAADLHAALTALVLARLGARADAGMAA